MLTSLGHKRDRTASTNELESLWWMMHQSDDESRQTAAVTCYLDESGTDEQSPIAVVGGLLLNKSHFAGFNEAWPGLLKKHSISAPLHMKAFRRPYGRLADVSNDARTDLFVDVVNLINQHKIYSVAATLTAEQFKEHFDRRFRSEGMGVYGMCFILAAYMNHLLAVQNKYSERIAFLMDSGNQFAAHVRGAHAMLQEPQWEQMNVGSLTFDRDEKWNPLQAADVIAWASRIRAQDDTFSNGYEPLAELFDAAHYQQTYSEPSIAQFADSIDALRKRGDLPL